MQGTPQNCLEVPATRTSGLFVLTGPIKFLICGVSIAVPVVHLSNQHHKSTQLKKGEYQFLSHVHGHFFKEKLQKKHKLFPSNYYRYLMYQSNRSLNIPPPGIPRAFDVFSCPRGREFDELSFPGGGEFDHYS